MLETHDPLVARKREVLVCEQLVQLVTVTAQVEQGRVQVVQTPIPETLAGTDPLIQLSAHVNVAEVR
jgi:hypothetical protein